MSGHVVRRGKRGTWYAVISTEDEFGKRKVVFKSLPTARNKTEAKDQCYELQKEMKAGKYIAKKGTTLLEWVEHWLSIGAPGKKKQKVGCKTCERYGQLLHCHVLPVLGALRLQDIRSTMIDKL